jgi:archaellum component FlaC
MENNQMEYENTINELREELNRVKVEVYDANKSYSTLNMQINFLLKNLSSILNIAPEKQNDINEYINKVLELKNKTNIKEV